ncbi:MAG: hydantoinase B/oxoprolinase family protein [Usitatibacter sp.]
MKPVRLDAISIPIYWTRLVSIVDEAAATFARTAFSSLVREANDFAVLITDREGRAIIESSLSIPAFIGTLPETIRHFIREFGDDLQEGDVLMTNDPWMGTGHVHDVSTAMPLFSKGQHIGFAAVASHVADIGGKLRGTSSREIYEEGLQIPLIKLFRAGKLDRTVEAFISRNVRVPEMVMGDLLGQATAERMVAERLQALIAETGVDFAELATAICARSETAMRKAIAAIPDGTYSYALQLEVIREPVLLNATVHVTGETLTIDFDGSSPQQEWAINVVPTYTRTYSAYAIKALLIPDVPNNDGCLAPIRVSAPEGSILNPRYPAATGARSMVGHQLPAAVMGAMAHVLPDRVRASGAGVSSFTLAGRNAGRSFALACFANGGQGASLSSPGLSALSFPSNMANTPIEVLEGEAPIRILDRSLRVGSGGAGQQRGGEGIRLVFRYLGSEGAPCSFMLTHARSGPAGLHGGASGAQARLTINGEARDFAVPCVLRANDVVAMETAGGGGFGSPE